MITIYKHGLLNYRHLGLGSNQTTVQLLADGAGHEILWSQNRVVQLEDNDLAGKDCLDPTHSNSSALSHKAMNRNVI